MAVRDPFRKSLTRVTPTLSVAFTCTLVVPLSDAPDVGAAKFTVGAIVSPV